MGELQRPLRVGFYIFFSGGGIGRYTHRLMEVMNARPDVEVEAFCSPDYEWVQADGYATWTGLQPLSHDVATLRRLRFLRGQFVNPWRAVEYAIERGMDVFHLANINHLSFPFWRPALERSGLTVAASAHDIKRQKSIISRMWEDRQLKAFYRFADALFVHSQYQAQELQTFAGVDPSSVHVVPHGPYVHSPYPELDRSVLRAKWDAPQDHSVGLFFGQIRDEKNLGGCIRALARCEAPVHLVVAGKEMGMRHRPPRYYREVAREAGVTDRITFHIGHVTDEEVAELFTAADWVALPYRDTFTSQSGVLNVAAHYERPVLVAQAPVLRETVENSGIGVVCDAETPHAIARGIKHMLELQRGNHAFPFMAYRETYTWRENARRTVAVYRGLQGR